MQKTSELQKKKETATGPVENKDKYWNDLKCSHAILMFTFNNLRTKY